MLFRSSLLTGVDVGSNLVLLVQTKSMKKIIVGAGLLLMIRTANATQAVKHSDERNILSTELPVNLQSGIKNQYGGYWITELAQEGDGKHAKYLLTLESADQIVHLEAGRRANWVVTSTAQKAD